MDRQRVLFGSPRLSAKGCSSVLFRESRSITGIKSSMRSSGSHKIKEVNNLFSISCDLTESRNGPFIPSWNEQLVNLIIRSQGEFWKQRARESAALGSMVIFDMCTCSSAPWRPMNDDHCSENSVRPGSPRNSIPFKRTGSSSSTNSSTNNCRAASSTARCSSHSKSLNAISHWQSKVRWEARVSVVIVKYIHHFIKSVAEPFVRIYFICNLRSVLQRHKLHSQLFQPRFQGFFFGQQNLNSSVDFKLVWRFHWRCWEVGSGREIQGYKF